MTEGPGLDELFAGYEARYANHLEIELHRERFNISARPGERECIPLISGAGLVWKIVDLR